MEYTKDSLLRVLGETVYSMWEKFDHFIMDSYREKDRRLFQMRKLSL